MYIWFADNLQQSTGKLVAIAEAPEDEEMDFEMTLEQFAAFIFDPVGQTMPAEQQMAMVKNIKLKRNKGGGKGPKGARPPRKCYECDAEDYIALNCNVRAARVAAGGLERPDDPMGKEGAKGKGKGANKGKG